MGARILAVDDEEGILRLLKRVLERDGNVVDTVSDPAQLLNGEKGTGQYDLILLDVMMPGIDGFTLLEMMRDEIDCPVLFLTAKTAEEDLMKGFGLGADDYIRKPFGIGELRARVEAHLRRFITVRYSQESRFTSMYTDMTKMVMTPQSRNM